MTSKHRSLLVVFCVLAALHVGPRVMATDARRAHHLDAPAGAVKTPARIVSLAPVVTETLFMLGAGPQVVGVTRFCDRPTEAASRARVGGFVDVQLEAVLALEPDLVIAMPSLGQRRVLDALRARDIPVAVVFADTLEEIRDLIAFLAKETGHDADGARVTGDLDTRLARAASNKPFQGKRVLTLVGTRPFVAAGPGTYADEIVRLTGGTRTLPATAPLWPHLSLEALLSQKPDVVLVLEGEATASVVRADLSALAKDRRPLVVTARDPILMRPGPSLVDDLDVLERMLASAFPQASTADDDDARTGAKP
jgi:iron complex transport system substrate-binding protein